MTFNLEKFQDLADGHKNQISAVYEEMGAGNSYTPGPEDKPKRTYFIT